MSEFCQKRWIDPIVSSFIEKDIGNDVDVFIGEVVLYFEGNKINLVLVDERQFLPISYIESLLVTNVCPFMNIAFIANDTTRTGGSILLVRLMTLLKTSGYDLSILIKSDNGPLAGELSSLASHSSIYREKNESVIGYTKRKAFRATGRGFGKVFDHAGVIFNNTFANGVLLQSIRSAYSIPIISYIHELQTIAKIHIDKPSFEETIRHTNLFAVPSRAVADFLTSECGVGASKIYPLDYYIPVTDVPSKNQENGRQLVIGGCGTADWRKGFDLFVQTAFFVRRNFPALDCRFVWKGGGENSTPIRHSKAEMLRARITDLVTFADPNESMKSFYGSLDVLLLTSREDPYPLVVLEAAAHSVPTICFENSGGAPEFIESDGGQVVRYVDVAQMAAAIQAYSNDRHMMQQHGSNAHKKLLMKHSDSKRIIAQVENIISAGTKTAGQ